MRQGQQNRRGRGRNNNNNNHNNNRKGQNPLTRSFESNGPDIKIRGTPAHIADKYLSLARDAQSSGDPVLAENYFQHAEHYNRIIMTFREQQIQQGGGDPMAGRPRPPFGDGPDGDQLGDDDDDMSADAGGQPQPAMAEGGGGQPTSHQPMRGEGQHRFEHRGERHDRQDRPHRHQQHQRGPDRGNDQRPHFRDRDRDRDRQGGGDRSHDRGYHDRGDRPDRAERPERVERMDRPERPDRPERQDRPAPSPVQHQAEQPPMPAADAPRRRERFVPSHEQPEFLRRPVRRPRREDDAEAPQPAPAGGGDEPTRD